MTDHRLVIVRCGHPTVDAKAMLMPICKECGKDAGDDLYGTMFHCRNLRKAGNCPDPTCLGNVDENSEKYRPEAHPSDGPNVEVR